MLIAAEVGLPVQVGVWREELGGGVNIEPMGIGSVPSCKGKINNKASCLLSLGMRQATAVHVFSSICCIVRPSRSIFAWKLRIFLL